MRSGAGVGGSLRKVYTRRPPRTPAPGRRRVSPLPGTDPGLTRPQREVSSSRGRHGTHVPGCLPHSTPPGRGPSTTSVGLSAPADSRDGPESGAGEPGGADGRGTWTTRGRGSPRGVRLARGGQSRREAPEPEEGKFSSTRERRCVQNNTQKRRGGERAGEGGEGWAGPS